MSIKKSSIQQALIEAREIEKSALDNARKSLEEELAPKIRQVAIDALKEFEQEAINEDITIKIATDGGESIGTPEITNDETLETLGDENEITNDEISSKENDNIDNLEEMDIFEINGLDEAEEIAQPTDATPVDAAAPVDAAPVDAAPADDTIAPEGAEGADGIESATVNQKLDDILAKLEAISGESEGGEGNVEIDDAEETIIDEPGVAPAGPQAQAPAPAPAPTPALQEDDLFEYELEEDDDMGEEVVYEYEDNGSQLEEEEVMFEFEDETSEIFNELDIVDEEKDIFSTEEEEEEEEFWPNDNEIWKEETMEEMLGVGLNIKHSTLGNVHENKNKIKSQNESKNGEIIKENESLKQTIKEYKESFVVLRKQINEVQIFNAKLAYANKLFTNGGLTNDEKIKIAEDFDKVQTIEEAKKLYNTFLSEMKISKSPKITPIDKLKSSSPNIVSSSNSQTLFESDEMRRMKKLAGISKKIEG